MVCGHRPSYFSFDPWLQGSHIEVASRWVEGMINKDVDITNEVYSISDVEFDRQVSFIVLLISYKCGYKLRWKVVTLCMSFWVYIVWGGSYAISFPTFFYSHNMIIEKGLLFHLQLGHCLVHFAFLPHNTERCGWVRLLIFHQVRTWRAISMHLNHCLCCVLWTAANKPHTNVPVATGSIAFCILSVY